MGLGLTLTKNLCSYCKSPDRAYCIHFDLWRGDCWGWVFKKMPPPPSTLVWQSHISWSVRPNHRRSSSGAVSQNSWITIWTRHRNTLKLNEPLDYFEFSTTAIKGNKTKQGEAVFESSESEVSMTAAGALNMRQSCTKWHTRGIINTSDTRSRTCFSRSQVCHEENKLWPQ